MPMQHMGMSQSRNAPSFPSKYFNSGNGASHRGIPILRYTHMYYHRNCNLVSSSRSHLYTLYPPARHAVHAWNCPRCWCCCCLLVWGLAWAQWQARALQVLMQVLMQVMLGWLAQCSAQELGKVELLGVLPCFLAAVFVAAMSQKLVTADHVVPDPLQSAQFGNPLADCLVAAVSWGPGSWEQARALSIEGSMPWTNCLARY